MPSLPVYDMKKNKVGTIELDPSIFATEVRAHLLNDAVRYQIAKRYEYKTANSFTRTEVHGTRKKIYKQKGTGQARHGDKKAPIFVGGGKAHGPRPRRVVKRMNKKALHAALTSALTYRQKQDQIFVIDKLELPKPSTKAAAQCLKAFGVETALFVNASGDKSETAFNLSTRNIPKVKNLRPAGVNVFDVLKFKNLLVSKNAIEKLSERLKNV